ncbi:hypothetical protein BSKO_11250 [Bryopsis sp. KO-2023]|nr:hypothetical protein BSKO_11250 [Bryopsis sp. KO-2023]
MALRMTSNLQKVCTAIPATRTSLPIVSVPTFAPLRHQSASKSPSRHAVIVAAEKGTSSGKGSSGSSVNYEELISEVQAKWDAIDDKPTIITYLVASVAILWVSSSVVNAFSGLPLIPKLLQLVGLVYTAWFVYRYLLFKSSRAELVEDIDSLKKKITGGED